MSSAALLGHDARPNRPAFVALYCTQAPAATAAGIARTVLAKSHPAWSYVGERVTDIGRRSKDALTGPMRALSYSMAVLGTAASADGVNELVAELGSELSSVAATDTQPLVIRGQQFVVRPEDFPLVAVCAVKRLDSLTREQFQQYWRDRHAAIAYRFPGGCGYRQLHTPVSDDDSGEPYDGVTTMHYPDVAFMRRGLESPDFLREVAEDEMRFLDHARSSVLFFHDASRE